MVRILNHSHTMEQTERLRSHTFPKLHLHLYTLKHSACQHTLNTTQYTIITTKHAITALQPIKPVIFPRVFFISPSQKTSCENLKGQI